MAKCKITKVTIQIGETEATITLDQAKQLKASLEELLGKNVIEKHEHHHHDRGYWRDYSQPWLGPATVEPFKIVSPIVTCDATNESPVICIN